MDPTPTKRGRPRLPTPERQQNRIDSKAKWRHYNREEINERKRLQRISKPESSNESSSALADFLESPRIHYARSMSRSLKMAM